MKFHYCDIFHFKKQPHLYCLGGKNKNGYELSSISKKRFTKKSSDSSIKSHHKNLPEMATPKKQFRACAVGTKIYVYGDKKCNIFEAFDCKRKYWKELASMEEQRNIPGMAALDKHVFVAGGAHEDIPLSSAEYYSIKTNTWNSIMPMIHPQSNNEMVSVNGYIYSIGCSSKDNVQRYDPVLNCWNMESSTINNHSYFGIAAHDRRIYVLSDNGFEVFYPRCSSWQSLPSPKLGLGTQLVSLKGSLLSVGGGSQDDKFEASSSIYEYDDRNQAWFKLPDQLDLPRIYHRAVVVNF